MEDHWAGGKKSSYGQAGWFSVVETQETRVQTDLPDNCHLEISATS